MKNTVKNIVYYIRVLLTVFICFAGVSIFFINSSFLCNLIVNGLHLKIAPGFTGGEIIADFFDDSEDDSGSGILRYPSNTEFTEGSLDLVRYTVHKPVYDAKWQSNPDYWQLDLEFRTEANPVRNIMIYIGMNQLKNSLLSPLSASSVPLFNNAENVQFPEDKPWNFAVWVAGNEGYIYDADGNKLYKAEMNFLNNGKSVRIRIPLNDKNIKRVYSVENTYHYVVIGAYSQFDLGGFMPIDKRRSNSRGGTKSSKDYNPLVPKLYDILGDNQQLAEWNGDLLTKATVQPVEVQMKLEKTTKDDFKDFKNIVYNRIAELNEKSSSGDFFGYQSLDEALSILEKTINENQQSAVDISHYGSCLAMKGGQSSVVQAVAYVNKAFEYLDKAVELSQNEDELFETLMNRASVCKSVPDSVFNKATAGAQDFIKLASIQKNKISTEQSENYEYDCYILSYLYLNAAECYKSAGKDTESLLMSQEAKKAIQ